MEQVVIENLATSKQMVVDSQFIYCGGLGTYGFEGRFWTDDSQYFYYTSAREGVPDGCGYWAPPLLRVGITDWTPMYFDAPAISPDGTRIASWNFDQLEIWELSGRQIAATHNPVPGSIHGPIVWSPDSRSVVYLLSEDYCPLGITYLVKLVLAELEPMLVLTSKDPSFADVSWESSNRLVLYEDDGKSWRFNLTTRELADPSE